ncbi:glycosyltransferase family 2 protein [Salmonirosea aquatica]|uniref:Glycosyltransferase n=1 Tax=Salmonirosea aquatica TaxID=2654236 RepID=A0A7C9F8D9_9BACT|nr:glycosyltransferase [Cytophagaceae bacterium SJW1-29]
MKISVIMPVYNGELYLREAIESILGQTYTDFEFIIINDGSTDTSGSIIDSYKDSRIKHIKNERNAGLVSALNVGIDLAQGEYIARMDADDISLPERFAKQVAFMNQHTEVGVCGTAYQYIGNRSGTITLPESFEKSFTFLSSNSCLAHPTVMIRRAVLEQHSIRYENDYPYAEDYAFWIRIGQVAHLTSLSEPLLSYRWHSANISQSTNRQSQSRARARILWYELALKCPLSDLQANYLEKKKLSWEVFKAGKKLIKSILSAKITLPVDYDYYGKLAVTEWELEIIDHFGLRGVIACLIDLVFRKKGTPTAIGLIAYYIHRFGVSLALGIK